MGDLVKFSAYCTQQFHITFFVNVLNIIIKLKYLIFFFECIKWYMGTLCTSAIYN